jgi:Dyp-type peroxidase family
VHGLLVMYHREAHELTTWVNRLRGSQTSGLKWMTEVLTSRKSEREPFGFRDGLSQPLIADSHAGREHPDSRHLVKLGEVLLGYEDNAGEEAHVLALPGDPDFGVNGTYLVARQIAQHVEEFWDYAEEAGPPLGLCAKDFAARIVGRTLDGDVLAPGGTPRSLASGNEFGFAGDADGKGCPLGAHIRRGNPRDMLGNDPAGSWDLVNRHRVLRRGRPFGSRCWKSYCGPEAAPNKFNEPGLMFVALNADIERQFEFVQQNWINDPGFAELAHERDPLIGVRADDANSNVFTISSRPVRQRVSGLKNFVTVQGGEYFFLPGLRSLGRLAGARP